MLRKIAIRYYLNENYNCAESLLLAASEAYALGLQPQDAKLLAGFGGGLGCGQTCGALCGALAAYGRCVLAGKAHDQPGFAEECAALVQAFADKQGSTECAVLREHNFVPGTRCLFTVCQAADVLEQALTDKGFVATVAE